MTWVRRYWFWIALALVLIGIGVALEYSLPPHPRCVIQMERGRFHSLTGNGKIVITFNSFDDLTLQTWDSFTGRARHEFFRGESGDDAPVGTFELASLDVERRQFSRNGRFCTLLSPRGLVLVDVETGHEWSGIFTCRNLTAADPKAVTLLRRLKQSINRENLDESLFADALAELARQLGGEVKFHIDHAAFAAQGIDLTKKKMRLPDWPMTAGTALKEALSWIGAGLDNRAIYLVRPDGVHLTTERRYDEERVWPPVFSPNSAFVTLREGQAKGNKLHVARCATGAYVGAVTLHPETEEIVGFAPDDEWMYFFASDNGKPLFTLWSTQTGKVVRTIADIPLLSAWSYSLASDGHTLLVHATHVDKPPSIALYDLRTGDKRVCSTEKLSGTCTFTPDGHSLVCTTEEGEMLLWDVPTGKLRHRGKLSMRHKLLWRLQISADSKLLYDFDPHLGFRVWNLKTSARLWPDLSPNPEQDPWNLGMNMGMNQLQGDYHATPDGRFFVVRARAHDGSYFDVLDPATGTPTATVALEKDADTTGEIIFSRDGKSMLTVWGTPEKEPGLFDEWLEKWLPPRSNSWYAVADIASGRVLLRVNQDPRSGPVAISSDGRTFLACYGGDDEPKTIECWDVPGRPQRWVVFGIPAALGGVVVMGRWIIGLRSRKAVTPTPPENVTPGPNS